MWLRNSLLAHYPDNMYLVLPLDSVEIPGDCGNFSDFTDDRLSWIPLQNGGGDGIYSTPTIGIFKDDGDHLYDALHIMHITVGSWWLTSSERKVRRTLTVLPKQSLMRVWVLLCMLDSFTFQQTVKKAFTPQNG